MGKRVLIVDDAAFMRMMLKDILKKMDMKFVEKLKMEKKQLKSMESYIQTL